LRRPATGREPYLRPEIGFTPRWFQQQLGIDFDAEWHTSPKFRRAFLIAARHRLRQLFPGTAIGGIDRPDQPLDLLTGTFGACTISAIYGIPIEFAANNWPTAAKQYLSDEAADQLAPPDLTTNLFFQKLLAQLDQIAQLEGPILGYINWQGVLNNAHRLRGEALFLDLIENPARAAHLFQCVVKTMRDASRAIFQRQRQSGVTTTFWTVSNCLVNLISADFYRKYLLPHDIQFAQRFNCLGVHNCAWNANPYLAAYAEIPHVAYIDMGIESDLAKARRLFPNARRAIMYPPFDLTQKSSAELHADLVHIAREYGPCDLVAADIDVETPLERVRELVQRCAEISHATES
jgi:hypothetical protein